MTEIQPTAADKELALDLATAVRQARTLTEHTEARMSIAAAIADARNFGFRMGAAR